MCNAVLLAGCGDDTGISIPLITDQQSMPAETQDQASVETQQQSSVETESIMETVAGSQTTQSALPEEISITISAAGDVSLGNYKDQDYNYSFRQTYEQVEDKDYFFANVADIFKEDDFTIVNMEGVLTFSEDFAEGRTYNIKGDPEYAFLLSEASVEAVSMANNHRLDYGEDGSGDTVKALEEAGIFYAYDRNLGIFEVEGIQIGWVSVNEATQGQYVERYLEQGIKQLREQGARLILASCHWGTERDNYPEEYQKELGRKCIDWGADLVIGHHPHVLQGIDCYQGKYIVYSLGNFCFGANRNPSDKDTMIFQQTFTFQEKQDSTAGEEDAGYGLVESDDARIIPCSVSSVSFRNNYQPTPLEGKDWERVIRRINEYSKEFGVTVDEEGILRQN